MFQEDLTFAAELETAKKAKGNTPLSFVATTLIIGLVVVVMIIAYIGLRQ